jgi:predicted RNA-binding protein YlxR (DUF448 family)/ribosomal protein L7Ae-like RNA K-turn-binding protein
MDRTAQTAAKRTCAGCRQKDDRDALLRLVLLGDPPRVVPDVRRRARGRGVSVHPRRRCVEKVLRGNTVQRVFRCVVAAPSADDIVGWAIGQYHRRIEGLMITAWRSRHIAIGREAVRDAINRRSVALLVQASDANQGQWVCSDAMTKFDIGRVVFGTKESNGRLFGREAVGVLGILDRGIAESIANAIDRCATLAEDS